MQNLIRYALLLTLAVLMSVRAWAGQERPLQIGVLPINTTRNMVKLYEPVREYLEKALQRPVAIVTAPDFKTFHNNTLAGEFDLIVTAAHLGRLAETERHYIPLVRYKAMHQSLLITSREHPLKSNNELKGQVIAGIDPLTMAMSDALRWLRLQGFHEGRDFTLMITPTPVSAAYAVKNSQAVLAVGSLQGMKQMPEALRNEMQVYKELAQMPSLMWLAHPRMQEYTDQIRLALLGFTPDLPEGAKFYEMTGYQGMREVSAEEGKAMDGVAQETRHQLERK